MVIETKVALAKKDTKSLKTTIPESIVEYLQLEGKDSLEWQMGTRDDERVALVRRVQQEPEDFEDVKVSTRRTGKGDNKA